MYVWCIEMAFGEWISHCSLSLYEVIHSYSFSFSAMIFLPFIPLLITLLLIISNDPEFSSVPNGAFALTTPLRSQPSQFFAISAILSIRYGEDPC